jgi:exopolysaccharide production protein ExoY
MVLLSHSYDALHKTPPIAPLSDGLSAKRSVEPGQHGGKRLFDISVGLLALAFLAPLILVVTGLMLIAQGRPIFIKHERIGRSGAKFPCFKLRSMVTNSDEALRKYLSEHQAAAEEWLETRKLKNDPRITLLGGFLRKSSVDELPQLLNVLRGEMSLVGPRPVVSDELVRYGEHVEDYKKVRPGLTGLWQVSGRSNLSYKDRVLLDVKYVREWSFYRDIGIMLKTVPALLKSSGSY